jgi:16S rRNA (cytosine1402-N4)-methyltransferase
MNKNNQNVAGEHIPVMLEETISGLNIQPGDIVVDCTTNRAGHSIEIVKAIGPAGILVCIDLDEKALEEAEQKLSKIKNSPKVIYMNKNFREIKSILSDLQIEKVDAVVADLGLSSQELDISGRGFTFQKDEPLLMTFTSKVLDDQVTAKDIVNLWQEETLADIIYYFADERYAKRIAKKIVETRKEKEINTTFELVSIIEEAVHKNYTHSKIHPATKTFQALRMAVNDEVGSMKDLVNSLPDVLRIGGRASIITFHSIEDRIVKQTAREQKFLKSINKKPLTPSESELKNNPRSRSAKLRIYEYNN